jgi:hypothetical protein
MAKTGSKKAGTAKVGKEGKAGKKLSARLKKQIRLTCGAIFLVTAIVIAFIPSESEALEQDKYAQPNEPLIPPKSETDDRYHARYPQNPTAYVPRFDALPTEDDVDRLNNPIYSGPNDPQLAADIRAYREDENILARDEAFGDISWTIRPYSDLGTYPSLNLSNFEADDGTNDSLPLDKVTLMLRPTAAGWELFPEFAYYAHGAPYSGQLVITKYLNTLQAENVEIPYQVYTQYYIVSGEELEAFKDSKDSVSPYTQTFESYRDSGQSVSSAPQFVLTYKPAVWRQWADECDKYIAYLDWKDLYDAWVADMSDPKIQPDPGPQPSPSRTSRPDDFSFRPRTGVLVNLGESGAFTDADWGRYYCAEHIAASEFGSFGPRYYLEAITSNLSREYSTYPGGDNPDRNGYDDYDYDIDDGTTGKIFYIARLQDTYIQNIKNGTETESDNKRADRLFDPNYFLVKQYSSLGVLAIGDQALTGNLPVRNFTLPEGLQYIGNRAFEGNTYMTGVDLGAVRIIGNRAFLGCTGLTTVKLGMSTTYIGTEAFRDCDKITSLAGEYAFPSGVKEIGKGAFAFCTSLRAVDFSALSNSANCNIDDYAFYGDIALQTVNFYPEGGGQSGGVSRIGDGAFAIWDTGNALKNIILPANIPSPTAANSHFTDEFVSSKRTLGNWLFENRSALETVVMPEQYGTTGASPFYIPTGMFRGCTGLLSVEFPTPPAGINCRWAAYEPLLFIDVMSSRFYVQGPGYQALGSTEPSYPRQSTWVAFTRATDHVPYHFWGRNANDEPEEYIEIVTGGYTWTVDSTGALIGCTLQPGAPSEIDLVIPAKVGTYNITKLGTSALANTTLRSRIVSITFEENPNLTAIDDNAFRGLPNLRSVVISGSIKTVGANAFADCRSLEIVTFNRPVGTPYSDYHVLGPGALAANSDGGLILRGVIDPDYSPFKFAMDPVEGNLAHDDNGPTGLRVCYKSLAPESLTVMYDRSTESTPGAGDGKVVLLDYPRFNMLDINNQDILASREKYWTDRYGYNALDSNGNRNPVYNRVNYDDLRKQFVTAFLKAADAAEEQAIFNNEDQLLFGPWVDQAFIDEYVGFASAAKAYIKAYIAEDDGAMDLAYAGKEQWLDRSYLNEIAEPLRLASATDSEVNALVDPFQARINADLKAYYDPARFPYSIQRNYTSGNSAREWETLSPLEQQMVRATQNIVIPAGVTSIDAKGYFLDANRRDNAANAQNFSYYFSSSPNSTYRPVYLMITGDPKNMYDNVDDKLAVQPGLFSGYYWDYEPDSANPNEVHYRGNDQIFSITMYTVESLPDYAFDSCEQLEVANLGAVTQLGVSVFRDATQMTAVTFAPDNDKYESDQGIMYSRSTTQPGTYILEQCLATRGTTVTMSNGSRVQVGNPTVGKPFDQAKYIDNISEITVGAFDGCSFIRNVLLGDSQYLKVIPEKAFNNCLNLTSVTLPKSVNRIDDLAFGGIGGPNSAGLNTVLIPGKEVQIATSAFEHTLDNTLESYIPSAAYEYANYYKLSFKLKSDDYTVRFYDSLTGDEIIPPQDIPMNQSATAPTDEEMLAFWAKNPETYAGYKFREWSSDFTKVVKDMDVFALYTLLADEDKVTVTFLNWDASVLGRPQLVSPGESAVEPFVPRRAGYTFTGWSNSRWNPVPMDTTSSNIEVMALYKEGEDGTGAGSGQDGADAFGRFTVSVVGGSGSGSYTPGTVVTISAYYSTRGNAFDRWTTNSTGVGLLDATAPTTTFVMPGNNVSLTATFKNSSVSTGTGQAGNAGASGDEGSGDYSSFGNGGTNARVEINLPGVPRTDLATARVNGSLDNFVVRINDDLGAESYVIEALTKQYGDITDLRYAAMDITLYDESGQYKITDTTGLTVDITMPLPTNLAQYGGNNRAISALNGDYDRLNSRVTSIDGVPMITFTTYHFSPYGIYVDLNNLSFGVADSTPKTGDGIHPKWFLVIGLVALSLIMFIRKDNLPQAKTA